MVSLLICLSHLQAELVVLCFPIQFLNLCVWRGAKAAPAPEPRRYVFLCTASKTHTQNYTLLMSMSCIKSGSLRVSVWIRDTIKHYSIKNYECKNVSISQKWFLFFFCLFLQDGWKGRHTIDQQIFFTHIPTSSILFYYFFSQPRRTTILSRPPFKETAASSQ